MENDKNFQNILTDIIKKTIDEYGETPLNCCIPSIYLTPDICERIEEIDKQYVEETNLQNMRWLGGLFYIDRDNKPNIYIKLPKCVDCENINKEITNMFVSLSHELTHYFDYIYLSEYSKEEKLRMLQENKPFLFWTEFHATYISYSFAIKNKILVMNKDEFWKSIVQKFNEYCSNQCFGIELVANDFSRMFGEYLAWREIFDELPQYPEEIMINDKFGKIYEFFCEHKSFEELQNDMELLNNLVYALENK